MVLVFTICLCYIQHCPLYLQRCCITYSISVVCAIHYISVVFKMCLCYIRVFCPIHNLLVVSTKFLTLYTKFTLLHAINIIYKKQDTKG